MLDCRCLREFYLLAITPTISFICENTEYDLIYLTTYHYLWQFCISQFCHIIKAIILQKFSQNKKRDC